MNYKTGTDFYIAVTNGSTDLITDESGTLIARYAYEPFGRINPYASDTDVDGDHKRYSGGFWYTGQEYELETDVYDFHARTYDVQTGRFMQPDPEFVAHSGYDSFDSYQYVYDEPVNNVDPDGKIVLSALGLGLGIAIVGGAIGTIANAIAGRPSAPFIVGGYIGPGANYPTMGKGSEMLYHWAFFNAKKMIQNDRPSYYYMSQDNMYSHHSFSMADNAAYFHDRDGGAWTNVRSIQANNKFMRMTTSM